MWAFCRFLNQLIGSTTLHWIVRNYRTYQKTRNNNINSETCVRIYINKMLRLKQMGKTRLNEQDAFARLSHYVSAI